MAAESRLSEKMLPKGHNQCVFLFLTYCFLVLGVLKNDFPIICQGPTIFNLGFFYPG